jgi:hypothetical protein
MLLAMYDLRSSYSSRPRRVSATCRVGLWTRDTRASVPNRTGQVDNHVLLVCSSGADLDPANSAMTGQDGTTKLKRFRLLPCPAGLRAHEALRLTSCGLCAAHVP